MTYKNQQNYVSTFRCAYKINFLIKFMQETFRILVEEKQKSLSDAIFESFKTYIEANVNEA